MMAAEESQQKPEPLGGDADGVNCLAYDEAIMAQQDRIQQEIAVQNPLVSERLELAVLYKEYAEDDHIYQQKIKDLLQKYSYIRKTWPDGNCFYRAFGFAHLEALLEDGQELQRFKEVSARSKEELVAQGFTEFTIEDFHNTVGVRGRGGGCRETGGGHGEMGTGRRGGDGETGGAMGRRGGEAMVPVTPCSAPRLLPRFTEAHKVAHFSPECPKAS
ncbi:ubiquitin thioesterase OTUB1-like [Spheniscus humboldti]